MIKDALKKFHCVVSYRSHIECKLLSYIHMECNMTLMYRFVGAMCRLSYSNGHGKAKRSKASESCPQRFYDFVDIIMSIFIYKATKYNDTVIMMMMIIVMMKKIKQQ